MLRTKLPYPCVQHRRRCVDLLKFQGERLSTNRTLARRHLIYVICRNICVDSHTIFCSARKTS